MTEHWILYGDVEISFHTEAIMVRPISRGIKVGVVGLFSKKAIVEFYKTLSAGGEWVYRWENEIDYDAGEYRLLVDRSVGIVWQGRAGDYCQRGSGPFLSYMTSEQMDTLVEDIKHWLETHTATDRTVVWLI